MAGGNNKKRKADSMDVAASEAKRVQRNGRTVEIIPEADVTLRVGTGENALDIRASGLVLGLASKTFKAMLSSGFIEGTTKVIDLDEEPQTVLDFCHVIHYKYESVKSMGTERLCNLIVFADMRQCHEPLKPWLLYVLREYVAWFERLAADQFDAAQGYPDRYPGLRVEDFVHIAASFGLCDLFWLATRAYIAISKRTMMACGHRYLVDKLPLASGHDGLSLYGAYIP
ncbi:hypothetical protein A1O7_07627 [Cladophialophora yegresii CBS 114405]|uniref:BTB domain-containing protein n=1 Tax=Cladophialophora yegresii CBS 114405 TaxID=1182544 RepID=W9VX46_9EURO|nr:uncharacterized protein A1O7_07627 [Cladophialophora yegresii CBS 114405]EXJ57280.1 hypothetical protein A1O7_07627 [Cladophialophora yegresii CBS 114405]